MGSNPTVSTPERKSEASVLPLFLLSPLQGTRLRSGCTDTARLQSRLRQKKKDGTMADYIKQANEKMMAAMQRLRETGSKEAETEFFHEMMENGQFLLPAMPTTQGGGRKLAHGVVKDREGRHYYMLFTDRDRLRAWSKGQRTSIVNYDMHDCCDLAINDPRISGFVLNPGTDDMIIARKLIEDMRALFRAEDREMSAERADEADVSAVYGEPTVNTEGLEKALRAYFRTDPNVAEAYLREMDRNGEKDLLLVIRHLHAMDPTFHNAAERAQPYLRSRRLAVMSARSPEAGRAIKDVMPFYRKPFTIVKEEGEDE